ncbi:hypothetical protein HPB48_013839 [Haemaphysalis longicornis]|uniref:Uncharacterized protein n=1 Tax=Haemaphysalis longicornis TaxID=44386 RepID=A0A9J6GIQ4_HAELO|nr:hypothetical protein HPB48_013839 [Haemaphysalis longicornis]
MPEVEMVEGVDISPEEVYCPGWGTSLSKKRKSRPEFPSSAGTLPSSTSSWVSRHTADPRCPARRLPAASRLPRLPRGQFRVIISPRDGIDVKKTSLYAVMRALTTAAGITAEASKQDLLCPNPMQNIYVLTTPAVKSAEEYAKVHQIILGTKQHAIAAYVAAPDVVRKAKRIKTYTTVVLLFEGIQAGGLRSALKGGARSPSNRGGSSTVDAASRRSQSRMRSCSGARRSRSSHRSHPGANAVRAGRSPGDDRDPDVTVPASKCACSLPPGLIESTAGGKRRQRRRRTPR